MDYALSEITNREGFLLDSSIWTTDIAEEIAKNEAITLTEDHWKVIFFLRDYYRKVKVSPAIRLLVKSLKAKYGDPLGSSLYLQSLFPVSPAVQAAKIAGLPKPKRCI